jgi:hypothetical protein
MGVGDLIDFSIEAEPASRIDAGGHQWAPASVYSHYSDGVAAQCDSEF